MRRLHVQEHIHWAEDDRGCLTLLNEETGQWHLLNATAAQVWHMASKDLMAGDVAASLVAQYPDIPETAIRADIERLFADLVQRGLIAIQVIEDLGDTWNEVPMAVDRLKSSRPRFLHLATSGLAFPIALILARIPFRWTARIVRFAKRRLDLPRATVEEANALSEAAYRVAWNHPGRVACYEHSLTVLVAAALSHRSVELHLGTATDPRRFHAWIETCGQVVSPDPEPCVAGKYQRVIRL